jgi:hypothetical protein
MKKKEKIGKLKNFFEKKRKKREEKLAKKRRRRITVDYCCNPQ